MNMEMESRSIKSLVMMVQAMMNCSSSNMCTKLLNFDGNLKNRDSIRGALVLRVFNGLI